MINQDRMNGLATQYNADYAHVLSNPEIKAAVAQIIAEERAHGYDALMTSRACRTRIHELLQSKIPMVDPPVTVSAGMKAQELLAMVNGHHDHQAAHSQALWQHADALYASEGK